MNHGFTRISLHFVILNGAKDLCAFAGMSQRRIDPARKKRAQDNSGNLRKSAEKKLPGDCT
jgi:hypothetical protein